MEMQNFQRHVVDKIAKKITGIIRSLRKEQAALNFLLTCCYNEETILYCIKKLSGPLHASTRTVRISRHRLSPHLHIQEGQNFVSHWRKNVHYNFC